MAHGPSSTVGNDADNVSSMQKSKAKSYTDARQSVPDPAPSDLLPQPRGGNFQFQH